MKKNTLRDAAILSLPVISTIAAWFVWRHFMTVVSLLLAYICISLCASCRKHESLCMFVLVGIVSIPINLELTGIISSLTTTVSYNGSFAISLRFLLNSIYTLIAYFFLISIEEIIFGIAGRMLWPRQSTLVLDRRSLSGASRRH